jgi:hypothetical protein
VGTNFGLWCCRKGDPATGDFSDAKVMEKFGDVPDDLSAL